MQHESKKNLPAAVYVTIEGVGMSAISGLLGQVLTAVRERKTTLDFDHVSVLQFMLFSAITTTPNYLWQSWMEDRWPTTETRQEKGGRKLHHISISNVVVKFILDQTLGSVVNTMLYFVVMGFIKGSNWSSIFEDMQMNFLSLLLAGYRFWPFICLLNLILVPMDYRSLVGSLAGLGWSVFLSLR